MRVVFLLTLALAAVLAIAAPVTLIKDGKCNTAIFVPPSVMEERKPTPGAPAMQAATEKQHQRLLDSVKDLSVYLGRIGGTAVPIYTRPPDATDKVVPILIGSYADAVFGPFTMKTAARQAMRYVVSRKGVGLQGETDESTSYAIYELLDRLGCRWYIPGEMGEVISSLKTVALDPVDFQTVPGTMSRNIWYSDDAYRRRNRLGGFQYNAMHALESYITKEQLEQHPDWNSESGGKRELHRCDVGYRLCWANPEVSAAVADAIIARLDKNYEPCISISPGDGMWFCDCAKCKALDAGDWDPSMGTASITDRYINLCNRIAERVVKKYPDVKLGFLAYVQYTRPPVREKLHPALIPQLAPITYCRAHAADDPTCESRQQVKFLVEGWGKASKNLAIYEYYYHLAEPSAPFPAIRRNVVELPMQYNSGVTMWTPETVPNFDNFIPGLYLGIRMSWYTKADPQALLNEFYTKFYGAAAGPMRDYWQCADDAWTSVPVHAGCGFSYLHRFTGQRMTDLRKHMDAALVACSTLQEYLRVKLADANLRQFELFMKMRRDLFSGKFDALAGDADRWKLTNKALGDEYQQNYAFTGHAFAAETVSALNFGWFFDKPYQDATRIARDFTILPTTQVSVWQFAVDKEKQGEALGWQKADFNDAAWKSYDVAVDNWDGVGLWGYFGPVWHRQMIKVPDIPAGKKVYLWVGSTDGACKVYVNGKHIPYINAKGEQSEEANGFCDPFSFDITDAVKPNADNQVAIKATRNFLNEIGTGGLIGPVLMYREK